MNIAVYCGSNPGANPAFIEAASQLGKWIGETGNALVYGGSSIGLMGAVSRATLEAGGEVFGVEPGFFIEAGVAQHDLTELIVVDTMEERKAKMIELADVFVALPGGVGTLEEISEIMSRQRLRLCLGPCYFLNLNGFFEGLRTLVAAMVENHFLDPQDSDELVFCNDIASLTRHLSEHRVCEAKPEKPVVPEGNLLCG